MARAFSCWKKQFTLKQMQRMQHLHDGGMKHADIANAFGTSKTTVGVCLAKIRGTELHEDKPKPKIHPTLNPSTDDPVPQ